MLVEELLDHDVRQCSNYAKSYSLYDANSDDDHCKVGAKFYHCNAGRSQQYTNHLKASKCKLIGENADNWSDQMINGTGVKEWR